MLQFRNVTRGTTNERKVVINTKFSGSSGYPMYFTLVPGAHIEVPKQYVIDWHESVKQNIAEYMMHGIIRVYDLNASHLYLDKGNVCDYPYDYLLPAAQGLALEHAMQVADSLNTAINAHIFSLAVHNAAAGAVIAAAVPTDLATLLVWLAAAQITYPAHIADGAAHPNVDIVNVLAPVVAIDLPTAVEALQELHRAYAGHKLWVVGTAEVAASTIAAY